MDALFSSAEKLTQSLIALIARCDYLEARIANLDSRFEQLTWVSAELAKRSDEARAIVSWPQKRLPLV